jgi:hypothetical protein
MISLALRPMLIRLGDASFVDDLCAHFRRSGFTCERAGGSMVEVSRPDAPSPDQERREVELHLRVWRAANAEATADALG